MTRRLAAAAAAIIAAAAALSLGGVFSETPAAASPADARAEALRGFAQLDRARVDVDPSRYPIAERSFREALRIGGADVLALRGLASLAAARHRFDESLALARRAQKLDPESAGVYALVGDASLELGRYGDAVAAFDRMMALKPTPSGFARVSYARELLGDLEGARDAMRASVDSAGKPEPTAWALVHLGNLYSGDEALPYYRAALARMPGYAPALGALADAAAARGELVRAERLYRRALARVADPGLSAGLSRVLAAQGRTDEARRWFGRAHELERVFARYGGRNQIETAELDLNHDRSLRDALVRAREGARLRPGVEGTHVLAWALYKNGRCGEAERVSDRALRLGPNDVDALLHRVLIERCLEKGGERYLARARVLDPRATLPSAFRLGPRIAAWPERSTS